MKINSNQKIAGTIFRAKIFLTFLFAAVALNFSQAQEIDVSQTGNHFGQKPIPVSLDGFSDDVAKVLKFDLYVQGFSFVAPDAAQYKISGTSAGSVTGTVTDKFAKRVVLSRTYTGAGLRRQAHFFADDIVSAVTGKKGIALTKIAFKSQAENGNGEIYVSDFDGFGPQAITHDAAIVASPTWVPGRLALCYNSYKLGNPDIFFHDLTTGQRSTIARYGGSNISPAVSPDGKRVAMVLSKGGNPDIYVADLDGSNLKQLTHATEDESSPCWSPDGQWICFAAKIRGRRALAKISVNGGDLQRIPTVGILSPTEPDWSPDGKWIAFTAQMGEFDICVVPADGGNATVLVPGERPSWSPNSRTLIFNHSVGYHGVLSVLDVFTKQVKDIGRISGSNSEAAWAR
jgi:TolB protein